MMYPLIGLSIGIIIGIVLPDLHISAAVSELLVTALVACLDIVFGGFYAILEKKFNTKIFFIELFSNVAIAAAFVMAGLYLGINLYFVVLLIFCMRIFRNISRIRRHLLLSGR